MITTHDRIPAARPAGTTAMTAALRDFQRRCPAYAGTAVLDAMRTRDYARLDATGHVYLDYTGGGLYGDSQLARHRDLLAGAVFGNPHSQNVPSLEATALVEATRAQILEFFRASPEEYEVIFTPNATGALRLVGESYPFRPDSRYLLTFDNHNSVNGIRRFARSRGASVSYVPLDPADLRVSEETLACHLEAATSVRRRRFARRRSGPATGNLFAFPAQSNFSGVQHPLTWIARAQAAGYDVLLDAAAFAPSNRLDLSRWHPDYVPRIYGPDGTDRRGATIAMNFFDPAGLLIDSVRVEQRANMAGISLRSGCHCNPGVREVALGYSAEEMAAAFKDKDRLRYQEFLHVIDGKTTGAARISLGLVTTFADVYRFWEFAAGFRDVPSDLVGRLS
jgi:selenocysteine lyase/cysteine desulfurase